MKLPSTPLHFIFYFVRQQWFKFLLFIFTAMTWATNDAVYPFLLKKIVNVLQAFPGQRSSVYADVKFFLILLVLFWLISEVFIVAHRLSTLANMDRILVFRNGKIVEEGSKEAVLALNGLFKMLWDMQTNGYLPDSSREQL